MTADEMDLQAVLSIFIPGEQAAICADCGGVFLLTARHCPGCGSAHWVLLEKSNKQAERSATEEGA